MKKWICLILALMLAVCFAAQAEESVWTFDYDDYRLEGYQGPGGAVVIPEDIDGCAVDILGMDLFNSDAALTSLTLPSTVKQVEENVASFCDNLTELVIPEGVQIIENNSFICNPALTEVVIPASVRYIGMSCFGSSESLSKVTFLGECPVFAGNVLDWIADDAEIYVPDDQYDEYAAALYEAECYSAILPSGANAVVYDWTIDPTLFDFDPSTGTITGFTGFDVCVEVPAEIDGVPVRAIGENAFAEHPYMCMLSLPEGIETIGASAFESCRTLLHIDFPSTLKDIGDRAFYSGYRGYALDLPSVEHIGDEAFAWCFRISGAVELPEGLKSIGRSAFDSCAWLEEVYVPASVESIGERAFAETSLNYLVFEGRTLPEMAENIFENCAYLADIDLHTKTTKQEMLDLQAVVDAMGLDCRVWRAQNPEVDYVQDGLEVYENGVWTSYTGEQSHVRPWDTYDEIDVTAIGDGLFKGNQTIEYFAVPYSDDFTTIGAEAFADSSVHTIDLFDSVTTINGGAFRNCKNLTELILPESVEFVGVEALYGCTELKTLFVLCDPTVLSEDLFDVWPEDLEIYVSDNATDEQVKYLSKIAGRPFYYPVTRMSEDLPQLTAMPYEPLPADDFWYDSEFARLDDYQGYELNLVLPREIDGVQLTMLGGSVMGRAVVYDDFEAELPVVSVVIPETYTKIVPYAFAGCEDLETVVCYAPIELLPDGAFQNCTGLREVIFVKGIGGIGEYVFDNCPNLETVYVGPDVDSVGEYAFCDEFGEPLWSMEQCITDPAQLPDVDALLAAVKCDPIPEPEPEFTSEPMPIVPVGEEGAPFFGVWNGTEMIMGGDSLNLADFEMTMLVILLPDGRMLTAEEPMDVTDPGIFDGVEAPGWYVENGVAMGDGCTITIMEDGKLMLDEGGMQLICEYFSDLPEGIAAYSGSAMPETAPEAPAQSAQSGMPEVKYVCVNADISGYTMDASMLGGEYSMIFHEGGAVDFVVVGNLMPGLNWTKQENGNFMVNMYGNILEIVWTEEGFDMNYMDSMLMHFVPEA